MIWRLGVVPYLNAEPLAAALREPEAAFLVGDAVSPRPLVPSSLIGALLEGSLDAALVSTAAVLPCESLRILPDMCVASRGPVRSIQLYCRKPLFAVRTVALDASSRSAVALTRVLFAERWRTEARFITMAPRLPEMLAEADAALMIGDPALVANERIERGLWEGPELTRHDLGAEWEDLTGLPFVYAVWAAPDDRDLGRLTHLLLRSKAWGMRRRGLLATRGAAALGISSETARRYLTENIHYDLGVDEHRGMERFCALAVRHGLLRPGSSPRLSGTPLLVK